MSVDDLKEINGLYVRWMRRVELKLTASEIYYIKQRLETFGLKVSF